MIFLQTPFQATSAQRQISTNPLWQNVLICNAMSSPRDSDFAADAGCSQEYIAPEGGHIGCNKRNAVFTGGPQAQGLLVQKPAGLAGRA